MDTVSEDFLDSWINLSTILRNKRYMVNLSFNEGVLCHILYKELTDRNNKRGLSVKEICNRTSLLKSQINKIINGLVDKGLAKRTKSKEDKRVIYISLNEDKIDIYKEEYNMVLKLIDKLVYSLGKDKARNATDIFNEISGYVSLLHRR